MPGALVVVLGHAGGWDETLMLLVPVAVFAGLLWLANKKAAAGAASGEDGDEDIASPGDSGHRSAVRGSRGTFIPPSQHPGEDVAGK